MKKKLPLIGYIILVIISVCAFYTAETVRREHQKEVTEFLYVQCQKDNFRDEILILSLENGKRLVESTIRNPLDQAYEMHQIQSQIDRLRQEDHNCSSLVPGYNG